MALGHICIFHYLCRDRHGSNDTLDFFVEANAPLLLSGGDSLYCRCYSVILRIFNVILYYMHWFASCEATMLFLLRHGDKEEAAFFDHFSNQPFEQLGYARMIKRKGSESCTYIPYVSWKQLRVISNIQNYTFYHKFNYINHQQHNTIVIIAVKDCSCNSALFKRTDMLGLRILNRSLKL